MKIVAIIPIKTNSKRISGKNFRIFNNYPLYEHFFRYVIPRDTFDEIYIDTDSEEIKKCARNYGFEIIDRPALMASDITNGNDLLLYESDIIKADIYFQLFITAPLLKKETIINAYNLMKQETEFDSLLTVNEVYSWFWFDNKPINYDPVNLPRSQDARPVIKETTGLYAIKKDVLIKKKCRIGDNPYFLVVNEIEGVDIDNELDFYIAEQLINFQK